MFFDEAILTMQADWDVNSARENFRRKMFESFPIPFPSGKDAWRRVVPLKIGIFEDIMAACPEVPVRIVRSFLTRHTQSPLYQKSISVAGNARVGLDGRIAGIVSADEALFAKQCIADRHVDNKIQRAINRIIHSRDVTIGQCAKSIAQRHKGVTAESIRTRLIASLSQEPNFKLPD